MDITAFIFDLDGVIVFTDQFHYQAWKQIADKKGIYFDEAINNRLRGVSRADSLEIILEKYEGIMSDNEKKNIMEEKNNIYNICFVISLMQLKQYLSEIILPLLGNQVEIQFSKGKDYNDDLKKQLGNKILYNL